MFAHRGLYTDDRTENSMSAIIAGLKHSRYDGVEVDVRFTRDGVAVLMHDGSWKRTHRSQNKKVYIKDFYYEELLKDVHPPIATLEAVLDAAKTYGKTVVVDFKPVSKRLFDSVLPLLVRRSEQVVFVILWFNYPLIQRELPFKIFRGLDSANPSRATLRRMEKRGFDGVSMRYEGKISNHPTTLDVNVYVPPHVGFVPDARWHSVTL